jgi:acetaldehyde dehydrogenase (EC 1.2.1.10)/alcohol dehydrogenase AdhE (EC 1.1.1.1)
MLSQKTERLVADGGYGHTSSLYINVNETEKMDKIRGSYEDLPYPYQYAFFTGWYR